MIDSKLIQLLRTFSTEEWRRFNEFVASPYFNKKEELVIFCKYLRTNAPNFSPKKLSKTKIFKVIYPKKEYDEKRLSYLMNYLLELAEKFIGWKMIEDQSSALELNTLSAFAERKLNKHYQQKFRKTSLKLNEDKLHQQHFYLNQFKLADIASKEFDNRMVRKFNAHLQNATNHLDHFYFLNKLKYCCGIIDRQQVLADKYELNFVEELKNYLLQQNNNPPEIDIYLHVLLMLTEEKSDQYFNQLKVLFKTHFDSLPKPVKKEINFALINFCLRKIRKGKRKYVSEALDIYQDGIQSEVIFDHGFLSPWTFTNVVKLALRLKRYDWIKTFIWENEGKISEDFRENALYYNLSELHYYTKDYDQALDYLNRVKFSDLNYHLGSRVILIKIYYETDEQYALTSLIASFTIFLKRNKNISDNLRKTFLNFCEILNLILRNKENKKEAIKAKIKETSLLTDRQWLLDILEK